MRGDVAPGRYRTDPAVESELDLRALGGALGGKKRWVIGVTLLAFLGTGLYVTLATPRYTGEAEILIENQADYLTGPNQTTPDPTQVLPDDAAVASQVEVVTSRDLARTAIKTLGLATDPEFNPTGTSLVSRVMIMLGVARAPSDLSPDDRIMQAYFDHLSVSQVQKSRVLSIDFWSSDPQLAAKAANTIADLYIGIQGDAKRKAAQAAAQSLATEIGGLKSKVADADAKTAAFRANNGLLLGNNNTTIGAQQLSDLTTQLAAARTQEADGQAKANLIRNMIRQARLDEVPDVANNDLIRAIEQQRVSVRSELALESRTLLPGHPRIKELMGQLADLDAQIKSAGEKAARTLENDAQIASARVTNLQAALDQQKQTVGGNSLDTAQLLQLDGDARLLREQLEAEMAKYQLALARQNAQSTPGDARVISRAAPPDTPSFPKKVPLMAFGTLAGFVLSLGAVVAGELLSGRPFVADHDGEPADRFVDESEPAIKARPRRRERLEPPNETEMPESERVAAEYPEESGDWNIAVDDSNPGLADIARRIGESRDTARAVRVLVTSSVSSDAAMQTAWPLAQALARAGRAILVDLGTSPRTEGSSDGSEQSKGLCELLSGDMSFAEVIHRDRGSRLHRLPVGAAIPAQWNSFDLILEALSQTYDYVVLAAPPPAEQGIALAVAGAAEFVVLAGSGEVADMATTQAHDELVDAGAATVLLVTPDLAAASRGDEALSAA